MKNEEEITSKKASRCIILKIIDFAYIVENTDNKRIAIYTVIIDNYDNLATLFDCLKSL